MTRLLALLPVCLGLLLSSAALAQTPTPKKPTPTPRLPMTATAQPQPRTMVALVFGQSNAANWGETRHRAHPRVRVFFRGRWSPAADPLPGADGTGGSVWTRLGDKLIAAGLYDRVIWVPAAIGGTEIAQWAPGGRLHKDLLRNVREARQAGLVFTHLLWQQGESDAYLNTSPETYQAHFVEMLAAIRALGVDAPVFIALATRCGEYPPSESIRSAQLGVVNPSARIFLGPDADQLDEAYRYDGCHFSAQGLEAMADLWLEVLRAHSAR